MRGALDRWGTGGALGLALSAVAAASLAEPCPADQPEFLHCEIAGNRVLQLCRGDARVSYRFGPTGGAPDLALSRAVGDGAEIVPWPGIGRTIWEAVRLRNADVVYEVYAGFDRIKAAEPNAPDSRFGGVIVLRDGVGEIAHLKCRVGTVRYTY